MVSFDDLPCFTFGWFIIYIIIASMIFGLMGAKVARTDPKTKEKMKGNVLGTIASFTSLALLILFLIGVVIGCSTCPTSSEGIYGNVQ